MKLYHVETQEDYDSLMEYLEEEGCWWSSDHNPTEKDYFIEMSGTADEVVKVENCEMTRIIYDDDIDPPLIKWEARKKVVAERNNVVVKDIEWAKEQLDKVWNDSEEEYHKGYNDGVAIGKGILNQVEQPEITYRQALDKIAEGLPMSANSIAFILQSAAFRGEPGVPIIPHHVADYIEDNQGYSLSDVISEGWLYDKEKDTDKVAKWLHDNEWEENRKRELIFAKAFLTGSYEIEEEQLHYAKIKGWNLVSNHYRYISFNEIGMVFEVSSKQFADKRTRDGWLEKGFTEDNAIFEGADE